MTGIRGRRAMRATTKDGRVFHILNTMVFTLFALLCAYPFYYIIINSMSDNKMVELGKVVFYPVGFTLSNYRKVLTLPDIVGSAVISVVRTILGTFLSVFATTYMAYFFSREYVWHKKLWYRLCIATMYFSAGLIPGYLLIRYINLYNTFWVYIVPGLISVYNMVLIKTYIESIPPSMEESAQIDGAGVFTRLIHIIIPLSIPILATISLFTAIGQWNSYMDTLLYVVDDRLYTLQFRLQMYFRQIQNLAANLTMQGSGGMENLHDKIAPTTVRLTITVVVTIPILFVYPFVQNYFVKGIMIGAVKG